MLEKYAYLDNASMTRIDDRAFEEMKKYFLDKYAIATSDFGYSMGVEAREH